MSTWKRESCDITKELIIHALPKFSSNIRIVFAYDQMFLTVKFITLCLIVDNEYPNHLTASLVTDMPHTVVYFL